MLNVLSHAVRQNVKLPYNHFFITLDNFEIQKYQLTRLLWGED